MGELAALRLSDYVSLKLYHRCASYVGSFRHDVGAKTVGFGSLLVTCGHWEGARAVLQALSGIKDPKRSEKVT